MNAKEAEALLQSYYTLLDKYITKEDKERFRTSEELSILEQVTDACIEAIAIVNGDEQKFKTCFELAKSRNKGLGWVKFDEYNAPKIALEIKALARIVAEPQ